MVKPCRPCGRALSSDAKERLAELPEWLSELAITRGNGYAGDWNRLLEPPRDGGSGGRVRGHSRADEVGARTSGESDRFAEDAIVHWTSPL